MTHLALPALGAPFVHPREGRLLATAATRTRSDVDARLAQALSANGDEALLKARTGIEALRPGLKGFLEKSGRETALIFVPLALFALTYPILGPLLGVDIFAPHKPVFSLHSILTSATAAVAVVSTAAALFGCLVFFKDSPVDTRTGRFEWERFEGTALGDVVTWSASAVVVGRKRLYVASPNGTPEGVRVTEIHYDALGKAEMRDGRLVLTDRRGDLLLGMPCPRIEGGIPDGQGPDAEGRRLVEMLTSRIPD